MIKKVFRLFLSITVILFSKIIHGQEDSHAERHHHEGYMYELGLSSGLAYLAGEDVYAPNAHMHMMKRVAPEGYANRWAVGLGVESIFTDHTHVSFLTTVSYNFIDDFIVDFSPGLLLAEGERQFITHIEITYESEYRGFGIGPILGMAVSPDDQHYMLGLHIGKGF